jgi:hypothetical protein
MGNMGVSADLKRAFWGRSPLDLSRLRLHKFTFLNHLTILLTPILAIRFSLSAHATNLLIPSFKSLLASPNATLLAHVTAVKGNSLLLNDHSLRVISRSRLLVFRCLLIHLKSQAHLPLHRRLDSQKSLYQYLPLPLFLSSLLSFPNPVSRVKDLNLSFFQSHPSLFLSQLRSILHHASTFHNHESE